MTERGVVGGGGEKCLVEIVPRHAGQNYYSVIITNDGGQRGFQWSRFGPPDISFGQEIELARRFCPEQGWRGWGGM